MVQVYCQYYNQVFDFLNNHTWTCVTCKCITHAVKKRIYHSVMPCFVTDASRKVNRLWHRLLAALNDTMTVVHSLFRLNFFLCSWLVQSLDGHAGKRYQPFLSIVAVSFSLFPVREQQHPVLNIYLSFALPKRNFSPFFAYERSINPKSRKRSRIRGPLNKIKKKAVKWMKIFLIISSFNKK